MKMEARYGIWKGNGNFRWIRQNLLKFQRLKKGWKRRYGACDMQVWEKKADLKRGRDVKIQAQSRGGKGKTELIS
jgi:hypothetical protein